MKLFQIMLFIGIFIKELLILRTIYKINKLKKKTILNSKDFKTKKHQLHIIINNKRSIWDQYE